MPRGEAEKGGNKHGDNTLRGRSPGGRGAPQTRAWGILREGLGCRPGRRGLRPDSRGPDLVPPRRPSTLGGLPRPTLPRRSPARASSSPTFPGTAPPGPQHRPDRAPRPPLSLPPHLKPPAPRWAPPCGNCPWRRGHGRPPGAAETGTDSSRQPALAPAAPRAAPSQSRRPPPASAPPRPRPRRKWGGGGGAGSAREAGRRSAWVGNALYCTRGGMAGPSPKAPGSSLCSHGAPR